MGMMFTLKKIARGYPGLSTKKLDFGNLMFTSYNRDWCIKSTPEQGHLKVNNKPDLCLTDPVKPLMSRVLPWQRVWLTQEGCPNKHKFLRSHETVTSVHL